MKKDKKKQKVKPRNDEYSGVGTDADVDDADDANDTEDLINNSIYKNLENRKRKCKSMINRKVFQKLKVFYLFIPSFF